MKFPEKLHKKLQNRIDNNSLRTLSPQRNLIDFASNDYLGFSRNSEIHYASNAFLEKQQSHANGSTGSRLLSGNHDLYNQAETLISEYHQGEASLIFNSGYDANVGFFSSVPQRDDIVLYDELAHASIRDGIKLGNAKAFKFEHNDFEHLEKQILKHKVPACDIYIVTESVFSMDGDSPDLTSLVELAEKHQCYLIIDEAHALGVFGENGSGMVQNLNLQNRVFARIMTYGKGLGCHGATIIGSVHLRNYLINFARSFIYTTALPPHAIATIICSYNFLKVTPDLQQQLQDNISHFSQEKSRLGLKPIFVRSKSAVQSAIIPGNESVRAFANALQKQGFDVKGILSPTVPEGQERLRFCIHSFNTKEEITAVLKSLEELLF